MPPVTLKKKKRPAGMLFAPASKAANILSTAIKRPKNTITFPYRKNRYRPISNRFSSRRIYRPYFRRSGIPKRRPTAYPIPSPTIAPTAAAVYDDGDIDLIGGSGQKSGSNKGRLSGKRHAGALQRNNDGNDPRSMDLDQTNQRTRERSKVHFRSSKSLAGMT